MHIFLEYGGVDGSVFADRTSKEYLKFLEKKFLEFNQKQQDKDLVLNRVLHRSDKIEAKPAGTAGQDPKSNPNPADFVNLTDSIHKLSLSVHHQDQHKSGIEYRPEYYVQVLAKGENAKNLSLLSNRAEELMFGMLGVYNYLMLPGGDSLGYFKHIYFVGRHLMERNFRVYVCARYDKYIVDQMLAGKGKFGDMDQVAVGLFLHGGATVRHDQQQQQARQPFQMPGSRLTTRQMDNLRDCNREYTPSFMPENWLGEICFPFNPKGCFGRCMKQHICGFCRLKHRLSDCKFALKQNTEAQ